MLSAVLCIFLNAVSGWYKRSASALGVAKPETGAVAICQRFGGSLNTVETEGLIPRVHGFFAHLEWDARTSRIELRLLLDGDGLTPVILHLVEGGLEASVQGFLDEAAVQWTQAGSPAFLQPRVDISKELAARIAPMVSLLLYLCSEEPDYGDREPRPHVRRAHWALRWTGPKTVPQKAVLRWLSPTLVGGGENVATVRKVKE